MSVATGAAAEPHVPAIPAPRSRTAAAVGIVAAAWIPALIALVLSAIHELPVIGSPELVPLFLLNAFVWGAVAGLLTVRRPSLVGGITAGMAVGSGISALAVQYMLGTDAPAIDPGFSAHVLERLWLPGTLASFSVAPLLLSARPPSRAVQALVAVGIAAAVTAWVVGIPRQRPAAPENPLAIDAPGAQDVLVALFLASLAVSILLAVVSDAVLIWRLTAGPADDRRGVGWLVIGQTLLVLFFSPIFMPWLPAPAAFMAQYAPVAPPLALVVMVAAVVVSSLGPELRGIDVVVNRVVLDVVLLAVLVLLYVTIALPLALLLPLPPTIAGVAGVVALALGLQPIRDWVQRRVDALVYGDAADPAQLLARLGARSRRGDADALSALVTELRDTLRLGALEVRSAADDGPVVAVGEPGGPETVLPLRSADAVVGWVRASSPGRQRVDRRTRRVLERIAGVLLVALQLESVNRDLAEARDRALEVGEEERRMVRRELRDGLAPALESSAVRLDRVPASIEPNPVAARAEVAAVRETLATRTAEVRDLARTLVPNALDAGDLAAALDELADRFSSDRLRVVARTRGVASLDPVRQVAVHHLAAEAVLLLRRSAARSATVRVDATREPVQLDVEADAPFATDVAAASILDSIADRAEDLGTTLEIGGSGRSLRVMVPA